MSERIVSPAPAPEDGDTSYRPENWPLIAVALTDRLSDGLSMVYSFYEPGHETRTGLGNFIILDHIRRAAGEGLPFVYLGYWVEGAARMQYKTRYRPLERLGPEGWERFEPMPMAFTEAAE